jgi:hypothetical protein
MSRDKLTISWDEINSQKVDEKLREREAVARTQAHYEQAQIPVPVAPSKSGFRWLYNSLIYMSLFGLIGGSVGWAIGQVMHLRPNPRVEARELITDYNELVQSQSEGYLPAETVQREIQNLKKRGASNAYFQLWLDPSVPDDERDRRMEQLTSAEAWKEFLADLVFYGIAGLAIAAFLAAAEPLVERNYPSAAFAGSVGAILGVLGGVVVATAMGPVYQKFLGDIHAGANLAQQTLSRTIGFGLLGVFLGAAPGLILRNSRKLWIGMAGGLIGGLLGGLTFEPLAKVTGSFHISRLVAMCLIGGLAGLAMGLIENAVKGGWLRVTEGLIAGKQFVLYRSPTFVGASPHCHIYLFKDPRVGKRHAAIHMVQGGFEIENLPLGEGTFVNGKPVKRVRLRSEDTIQVGSTVFVFQERARPTM